MGLTGRMYLAISLLFALLFAVVMAIMEALGYFYGYYMIIPLAFALIIIIAQWAVSPFIISWIYRIDWVPWSSAGKRVEEFVITTCKKHGIAVPRFGIIPDSNPNAFCYGWTKNRARVVVTRGILEYCDEDERIAVIGHELGHIVHNDFVVMTIIASVPLIFYIVFRSAILTFRYGERRRAENTAMILAVAAISFALYMIGQMIALLISRYREYWADRFSAQETKNPNALASALVKIAYGLAHESRGDEKARARFSNSLMIMDAHSATALTYNTTASGKFSKENVKRAMAWDLWNPWAKFLELPMTHPLPAKRILALSNMAKEMGMTPYIEFDLVKPESYWDDFIKDVMAKYSFLLGIVPMVFWWYYTGMLFQGIGLGLITAGIMYFMYLTFYRYPKRFRESCVKDLVANPKASPNRGIPVVLRGKIIGRGAPGLFYSEDLKLDDGTGLILLDYHQISPIIDTFVGIFMTEQLMGLEAEIKGWYRRKIVPYVEIFELRAGTQLRRVYTTYYYKALSTIPIIAGLIILSLPL
ncbi:MAG: hypothetical protein DRN20_00785 [Thermoplasmata archaeon]|nr:MAG: hypothetical protein DRN20_00785 [Thermoplasmata archaeon]